MNTIINIAEYLLNILTIIIFVQVVLSWLLAFNVINFRQPVVRGLATGLDRMTGPLYRPIRKLLPDFGGLDFSPLVLLMAIRVLMMLLDGLRPAPGLA